MDYQKKYLKYKIKYVKLLNGGEGNEDTSSSNSISSRGKIPGPEDPRIFTFNNDKYLLYNNFYQDNQTGKKIRHMYIRKINNSSTEPSYRPENNDIEICVSPDISKDFEKNWGPFQIEDDLYFLYSIVPLKIIKYNNNTCSNEYNHNNSKFQFLEKLYSKLNLHIRNSSPLCKFITEDNKNYYLGVGHSVLDFNGNETEKKSILKYFMRNLDYNQFSVEDTKYFTENYGKIYYTFFYILEYENLEIEGNVNKNFNIISITPMFQFEDEYDHTIEFACDLSIVDNDIVYIGYGINDDKAYLQKMYLKDILNLMIKLEDINHKNYDINSNFLPKLNTFLCNKISIYKYDMTPLLKKYISDQTIFNLGIEHVYGDEFLICARCLTGDVRKWDGQNSIILINAKICSENFINKTEPIINKCWVLTSNLEIEEKTIN